MRNSFWTKGLVVGIILLFIGASVVSGFNTNSTVQKTQNKSTLQNPTSNYTTFIFGKITSTQIMGNHVSFQSVNTIVIIFFPFSFSHYSSAGKYFEIFKEHRGFIGIQFIFALTNPYLPFIDCISINSENKLLIVCADGYVKWMNIEATTDNPVVAWQVCGVSGPLDNWNSTANITTDVSAGDYIKLTGTTGNVSVTLRYIPTNLMIGTWTVNI
jgi:hypothetical protein